MKSTLSILSALGIVATILWFYRPDEKDPIEKITIITNVHPVAVVEDNKINWPGGYHVIWMENDFSGKIEIAGDDALLSRVLNNIHSLKTIGAEKTKIAWVMEKNDHSATLKLIHHDNLKMLEPAHSGC